MYVEVICCPELSFVAFVAVAEFPVQARAVVAAPPGDELPA